jgi:hypothetical protein
MRKRRFAGLWLVALLAPAASAAGPAYVTALDHLPFGAPGGLAALIFEGAAPTAFTWQLSEPSPFNPTVSLAWAQPGWMEVTLTTRTLTGQVLQSISLGLRGPGRYRYQWIQPWSGAFTYTLDAGDLPRGQDGC